jgi:RNA polymerase sigma factor (sigma-70 family)
MANRPAKNQLASRGSDPSGSLACDDLLVKAREHDFQAFCRLANRFSRHWTCVAAEVLGQEQSVLDVVHDAYVRAFEKFDTFAGKSVGELYRWLETIVYRTACSRRRRPHQGPLPEDARGAVRVEAEADSPSQELLGRETVERMLAALGRLPTAYREIIVLRVFERQEYERIAARLGKTYSAVRQIYSRALRRLREELEIPRDHS